MENLSIAVTFSLIFLPFFVYSQTQKIDINSAPLEDLVKIIYIGEKRAKELISLRPFSSFSFSLLSFSAFSSVFT
jgi:DNA uptake protein ComE-like DNA-binding protein